MNYATLCYMETQTIYHAYKQHRSEEKGLKLTEVNRGLHPRLIRENVDICGLTRD